MNDDARLPARCSLTSTFERGLGRQKTASFAVSAAVAAELAELAQHEPVNLKRFRDHLGLYSLFVIDLAHQSHRLHVDGA